MSTSTPTAPTTDAAIRPFRVDIPQSELDDLKRRILATRWPTQETVDDASQGVQLSTPLTDGTPEAADATARIAAFLRERLG